MDAGEQVRISGRPATGADVLALLGRPPTDPVFIDFLTDSGWITLQANLVNRCWQVFRTLPDGGIEFTTRMLTPQEAAAWWREEAGNPAWYAGQTWLREKNSGRRLFWRLVFLSGGGLILAAIGIYLIYLAARTP